MRWIVVLAAVAGCGKSTKKREAPPTAPATGPTLPAGAICSGHWTAKVDYNASKTCKDDQLAPYLDLDFTITAGPTGWTGTVAKPTGVTAEKIFVSWETGDSVGCNANVTLVKPGVELSLRLWGSDRLMVSPRIDLGHGTGACMGSGGGTATLERDGGAVPPPDAKLVAFTGTYHLDFALPATYECDQHPKLRIDPKQTLEVSIDRANGDALVVTGLTWEPTEVRDNGDGELYVRANSEEDQMTDFLFVVKVDGTHVTGRAETSPNAAEVEPVCPFFEAKVTGTRTPK